MIGTYTTARGGRLAYIDALRGVSILLVVLHHILGKMGPVMSLPSAMAVRDAMASFRLPLFFFVSGFFAYRMASAWTPEKLKTVMSKKVCAQIVGTAVFASAYFYCFHEDVVEGLAHIGATRYWFTVALFQMFLVYLLTVFLTRRGPSWLFPTLLIGLAVAGYAANMWETRDHRCIELCNEFDRVGWGKLTFYFPYFAIGVLCRRSGEHLWRLMENKGFTAAMVLIFVASLLCIRSIDFTTTGKLLHLLPGVTGVICLLGMFYKNRDYFSGSSKTARGLCFIGRRTLDIYFLHYFFIPDLAYLPLYFYQTNPIVPMLLISGIATACVTVLSLVFSSLLRLSPVTAYLLFGAGK